MSTRAGSTVYQLADRLKIEPLLEDLLELDDPEAAPEVLVLLYRELLAKTLDALPKSIKRLVIVPDGGLYHLPFELLRPSPETQASLAAHYHVSYAPSATLWLYWRRSQPTRAITPALVLAAPQINPGNDAGDSGPGLARNVPQSPLPYARREGRMIARRLNVKNSLRLGVQASEHFLKNQSLSDYALVHFATHARVSSENPGRSAVFLAPGSDEEDGWLQPHEILQLDVSDRLVVLGACDSVTGELLRGEGTMSLARAFFQAGARAVVGRPSSAS